MIVSIVVGVVLIVIMYEGVVWATVVVTVVGNVVVSLTGRVVTTDVAETLETTVTVSWVGEV